MATIDGVLGFTERLAEVRRRRSAKASSAVERHGPAWAERGVAPSDLLQLLASRQRSTAEVSSLLGCTAEEAEALLWGLGFAHDPATGTWVHRGDEIARFLADDIELSFADAISMLGDQGLLGELAANRLTQILITGGAPEPSEALGVLSERIDEPMEAEELGPVRRLLRRLHRRQ